MRGLGAALSLVAVLAFPGAVSANEASPAPAHEPGEVLVRLEPGASLAGALKGVDAHAVERLPLPGLVRVELEPGTSVAQAEAVLERRPEVRYAQPNRRYRLLLEPNDPFYTDGSLWGLNQSSDADIDAPEAWNTTTGSSAVTVAVVDSGVEHTHPDLSANIWSNPGEVAGDSIDNDGNGRIDDVRGWDFVQNDAIPQDNVGHGTHVAGTVGARGNNGIGVAGVNWNVRLMALRAGDTSLTDAAIAAAFQYACAKGAKVVNGSFGGEDYSQVVHDAIAACPNALFVFAAGNDATNNDQFPSYPCADPSKNVLCVAATDATDNLASFSNYGLSVELGAPGAAIRSTYKGGVYAVASGTSMAAPHAAGAAALVLAARPTLSPIQVRQALVVSVDRLPALAGRLATGGRLNVGRALAQDIDPPADPTVASQTPVGVWTNSSAVAVSWSGASDPAGIGGYSFAWSPDPAFVPDETKDAEANVTSQTAALPDGQQWFHLRAADVHGNFGTTKRVGPFLIDTFPPVRPTLSSPTHRAGVPSADRTIELNWAAASDSASGLDGFSFAWSRQQLVPVDQVKDAEENVFRATSQPLDAGVWWFGIRARDNAGNWTDTVILGPFVVTVTAPVCTVPRLRGLSLIAAKRLLQKRGCALGRVTRAYSPRVARGRVIAQKRLPGLRLARGTKVAVVLSRGRRRR
jgi:subtilisin family serine protease